MDAYHQPVLVQESLELLAAARGGLFIDCTLGPGGHAEALLEGFPEIRLLGVDRDPQALELAADRLARFGPRVQLVCGNFHHLSELSGVPGKESVAGILADLGVSSLQLDRAERGFSFRAAGPLDMRMGRSGPTARDIVNEYPEAELERIFKEYGEEAQARRIARAVVEARKDEPFETTIELAELVTRIKSRGRRGRSGRIHPATQVFQALRIEVNQELAGLGRFIDEAVELLEAEGRLVIISYHSLEDRIVKNRLRDLARGDIDRITGRPRTETQLIEVLTKRPVTPSETEVEANPRSRSAKLRAARKL